MSASIGASHSPHPPTQDLFDALHERGWVLDAIAAPGEAIVSHPMSGAVLRQLVLVSPGTLDWVMAVTVHESNEAGTVTVRSISLLAAAAYVREEWNPQS